MSQFIVDKFLLLDIHSEERRLSAPYDYQFEVLGLRSENAMKAQKEIFEIFESGDHFPSLVSKFMCMDNENSASSWVMTEWDRKTTNGRFYVPPSRDFWRLAKTDIPHELDDVRHSSNLHTEEQILSTHLDYKGGNLFRTPSGL